MLPKIPSQDSNFEWDIEDLKNPIKDAAEADSFLFGDFDYSDIWKNNETNDVY